MTKTVGGNRPSLQTTQYTWTTDLDLDLGFKDFLRTPGKVLAFVLGSMQYKVRDTTQLILFVQLQVLITNIIKLSRY